MTSRTVHLFYMVTSEIKKKNSTIKKKVAPKGGQSNYMLIERLI